MNKAYRLLAICAFAALTVITSCATPTYISSKSDTNYQKSPKRLFVLIDLGINGEGFGSGFSKAFSEKMTVLSSACDVSVRISAVEPLALDNEIHGKRFKEFGPDTFLVMQGGSGLKDVKSGVLLKISYDAKLYDIAQPKKAIWRGLIEYTNSGFRTQQSGAEELARSIVSQLRKDGIFRSCKDAQIAFI